MCAAALMKKDLALPIGMEKLWIRKFAVAVLYDAMILLLVSAGSRASKTCVTS